MIILEGPNTALRETLRQNIERKLRRELGDQLRVNINGTPGLGTTAAVVRMLNTPNQTELRDGLALAFPDYHPIYHMAAYALNATGSIFVHALDGLGKYLPTTPLRAALWRCELHEPISGTVVDYILDVWRERQKQVARSFPYGGTGYMEDEGIMVVGERVNPFRPWPDITTPLTTIPFAFTSNQGCSFFLHSALAASGGRFYLTNAMKTLNRKLNRTLLADELATMKPRKIIAMGSEAAIALSEQRVSFTQTYHPQYWKRFKSKDVGELIELFRSVNNPNKTSQL